MIEYTPTHFSVNDGSMAMRIDNHDHMCDLAASDTIVLMNEDGIVWAASRREWEPISIAVHNSTEPEYPLTIFTVSIAKYEDAGCCYTLTFFDGTQCTLADGEKGYWTLAHLIDRQAETKVEGKRDPRFTVTHAIPFWEVRDTKAKNRIVARLHGADAERLIRKVADSLNECDE